MTMLLFWPSLFGSTARRLAPSLLSGAQMLVGSEVQEHRLKVWLDGSQLRDVQALIGQELGNDCKIKLVIGQADFENPVA
jgi:hypothetical protein